jgi:hypothetical protein
MNEQRVVGGIPMVWLPTNQVWVADPLQQHSAARSLGESKLKRKLVDLDEQSEAAENDGNGVFDCPICLASFKQEDRAVVTKCMHHYCFRCISRWLFVEHKRRCPLCQQSIDAGEYVRVLQQHIVLR